MTDGSGFDDDGSIDEEDQLQPEDTLDDRGVDDVLDEGYSPPDYEPKGAVHGLTAQEMAEGETLDERLAEEEPDFGAGSGASGPGGFGAGSGASGPGGFGARVAEDAPASAGDEADLDEEDEVGDRRAGRIVAPDEGGVVDAEAESVGSDVGIDGAGASAEEAAVHYIEGE